MKEYYRVHADVNLDAIYHNCEEAKKKVKDGTKLMAIVKADAYGHGAVQVARKIDAIADAYGIAILEEGIELRRAGITKPILILGFTPWQQFDGLFAYDITQTVYSLEMAQKLSDAAVSRGKKAHIHIKIDTGMGRIGFFPGKESLEQIKQLAKLPGLAIDGCFTHFARADEKDKAAAKRQLDAFLAFVEEIKACGISLPVCHAANSAAIMELPQAHLDMVRLGIALYGLYPSKEVCRGEMALEPAMELRSCVSFVKEVPAGTAIGYGGTFVTTRTSRIATIPVGYADGFPRSLSGKGSVIIQKKRVPIVGRICMDQFMVDVTELSPIAPGEPVILFGREQDEFLSVEEVSEKADSFHYEFVCDVGKRVPRVYYEGGKAVESKDYY